MVNVVLRVLIASAIGAAAIYQGANMWAARAVVAPGSLFASLPLQGAEVAAASLARIVHRPYEQRYLAAIAITTLSERPDDALLIRLRRLIDELPHTASDDALRARLAALQGDRILAFNTALQAGQMDLVHAEIDDVQRRKGITAAIVLEERVVARFTDVRTARETLADTYWRLGALENAAATQSSAALEHRLRARDAFEANVRLTPLSGRAQLSAGYANLALGETARARSCFANALASDPASASALVGLARTSLFAHDTKAAAAFAARARAIAPAQDDVRRLEADLHP